MPGEVTVHGPRAKARQAKATGEKPAPQRPLGEAIRSRESVPLSPLDLSWAGAATAIAAVLFATTLPGHPALGDAPESIAGVESLGVLHAPGYPAYVLAAWLFTLLVPFGSFAFQVNLFSLACASLSIGVVYLLARRCGAARWASALGALALATGGAFWFYADFAKHDAFSGLAFVAALYCLIAWQAKPSTARLVAVGALMGVGIGSSWPLMLFLLPAIGFAIFLARRQVSLRAVSLAAAVGVATVLGLYGFLMARAAQDPAVNWGDATTIERLSDLVNRADFTPSRAPSGSSGEDSGGSSGEDSGGSSGEDSGGFSGEAAVAAGPSFVDYVKDIGGYIVVFYHELGLAALALAAWGLVVSLAWRRGPPAYSLLLAFGTNLVGTGLIVGASFYGGFDTVLVQEGFILGCYFVLPAWIAIGATELAHAAAESGSPRDRDAQRAAVQWAAPAILGLAVLLPSLIMHWDVPRRSGDPFADRYAQTAFAELPDRSAVFIFGAERTQPLIYRQVVLGDRPDADVIATDGLSRDWYREQSADRLGVSLPPPVGNGIDDAVSAINAVRRARPVYMDVSTAQLLDERIGYRQVGLMARVTEGRGPAPATEPDRVARALRRATVTAGMPDPDWELWPNNYVLSSYTSAGLEVARAYFQQRDEAGLRRALLDILRVDPDNLTALNNLRALNTQGLPGG